MIEQTNWFQLQPLYQYIRKQSENRQFFKYVEIGATFFLIAIFLFFAIMPTASAISSLIGEIKSKETISNNMSKKIASIMQAQESFSQIQGDYSVIESSYPVLPNFYKSVHVFSSISRETSTPIKKVSIGLAGDDEDKKDDINIFTVNLNTIGTYSSLLNSINKISGTRRLVDIKSIKITQDSKDSQSSTNQLNIDLSADLYYLPKKQP